MAQHSHPYATIFKFSGNGICTYNEFIGEHSGKRNDNPKIRMPNSGQASGVMTISAKKRVKRYLDLWYNAIYATTHQTKNPRRSHSRFLTFVTLTLPSQQRHDDQFIKRQILQPFLSDLHRLYSVAHHIWKAELQNNGNIHFHVLIDKYIHHTSLRHEWNRHVDNYGYVRAYSAKRILEAPTELSFLKLFNLNSKISDSHAKITALAKLQPDAKNFSQYLIKHCNRNTFADIHSRIAADLSSGFISPNSTDIHAPHKIKNLCAYVLKYICKNENRKIIRPAACYPAPSAAANSSDTSARLDGKIFGRVWGCSDGLRTLQNFYTVEDSATKDFLTSIRSQNLCKTFDGDFFQFCSFNLYKLLSEHCHSLFVQVKDHFRLMFKRLYPPSTLQFQTIL